MPHLGSTPIIQAFLGGGGRAEAAGSWIQGQHGIHSIKPVSKGTLTRDIAHCRAPANPMEGLVWLPVPTPPPPPPKKRKRKEERQTEQQ